MTRYNKLVRDKIPDIIKQKKGVPLTHIADNEEYWQKLKEKLQEEIKEFIEAESAEEMADILEVIDAVIDFKKFDRDELQKVKNIKAEERGRFENKIILEES